MHLNHRLWSFRPFRVEVTSGCSGQDSAIYLQPQASGQSGDGDVHILEGRGGGVAVKKTIHVNRERPSEPMIAAIPELSVNTGTHPIQTACTYKFGETCIHSSCK